MASSTPSILQGEGCKRGLEGEQSSRRGLDTLLWTADQHQWTAMRSSCDGEISRIKQGLEDMFGFSRKLVHGLNSASSCYEKKTESELTASNPACKSRLSWFWCPTQGRYFLWELPVIRARAGKAGSCHWERQLGSKAMIQPALCLQGAKVADFREHEQGHSCTQPHPEQDWWREDQCTVRMEQMWNLNPERWIYAIWMAGSCKSVGRIWGHLNGRNCLPLTSFIYLNCVWLVAESYIDLLQ